MDELGSQLAELAEEAAGRARPAGPAAARRRGARRRRRQAAGALLLVASLVAGLVWVDRRPLPSADATKGWKTYTDTSANLRFSYPSGWNLDRIPKDPATLTLVPPEDAGRPLETVRYLVTVSVRQSFWVGEWWIGTTPATRGRLPSGHPYLHQVSEPQVPPGKDTATDLGYFSEGYSIDWGRSCGPGQRHQACGPHTVIVISRTPSRSAWDRYRTVTGAIARSATQLRPTGPSVGDRSRPACRPDQWRLVWPGEHGYGGDHEQWFVHQGGVRYRQGPSCHLRLTLRLTLVDGAGRLLPVVGNPATTTVEGDLPEDQIPWLQGSWSIEGALMWRFTWQGWCNKGLPPATLRVTAGGATLTSPGPGATSRLSNSGKCRDTSHPSTLAGWPK